MNLVLLEPAEIGGDRLVRLADTRAAHLITVLRVVPDQIIRVGLVDGPFGTASVRQVTARDVTLCCEFEAATPGRPPVDLLLALPRPKVLGRLWAQLAALGVGRILLTNAERVERNYFDTHLLDPAGYRPRLIEGLQQARDTRLPLVSVHRQFRVLVEDDLDRLCGEGRRLVADPAARSTVAAGVVGAGSGRVLLAVGPEGGWNRFELQLLAGHGFVSVGLGARTLRTDTACVALLALVHDALRQRRPDETPVNAGQG